MSRMIVGGPRQLQLPAAKEVTPMTDPTRAAPTSWPVLPPVDQWRDSLTTVHMWTQIVGKVRLELAPPINHWWGAVLYVTTRGLTTSPIPAGKRSFAIDFDFVDHALG